MTLTVNPSDTADTVQQEILTELKKHTEYLSRIDWKLWVTMNMIESIARESGYEFEIDHGTSQSQDTVERVRVVDEREEDV